MKKLILTGMILTGIQMMAHIPPIIYNIKNNSIYWINEEIKGVDFKTFEILKNGYSKDKNNVYYKGQKIEEADSETFEITISPYDRLNASHEAKDKNHKYHYGKIITN